MSGSDMSGYYVKYVSIRIKYVYLRINPYQKSFRGRSRWVYWDAQGIPWGLTYWTFYMVPKPEWEERFLE
jgi:hypothetical protein